MITLAELLAPGSIDGGQLLTIAPAMAPFLAGIRATALTGGLAVAAQTSLAQINGGLARTNHMQQFIALIALSALAVLVCFAWERHQRTLERVRTVSEAVQQVLLPPLPPHVGVVRTASHYLAAAEAAQVGGDLYAVTRVPGRCTRIILGDARGHGLEAVPDASRLINAFWETAHRWAPLPEIVADMEASVCCRLSELPGPGTAIAEHLITAVVVEIPDDHGPALIVNCGHPPPLLLHEGVVTTLEACEPTPPMGLCELTGCPRRADPVPFAIGDMLLLYTDGVIEARDTEGSFYPLAERIATCTASSPDVLLADVHRDLLEHVGSRLTDDAAMVAIEHMPSVPHNEPGAARYCEPGAAAVLRRSHSTA
ncbi:PP2C family protein-serine/threonine phosphatase [Streptomyces chiangmaiensis]|uniref:PP2C family protein-serine/threonine phosphatase n=1 Tax=Streptomyces chiangmaiensis TaxID=766497 RepID=A0ABU7FS34_9ACTN|nr:PP2C family protein-serine/threonine phosphatase [Streptomyces chiangmaiensis]MED7826278.1 PP2C family protein-serine/threonine phosphatase [Streptomyces chiangmaiensis]